MGLKGFILGLCLMLAPITGFSEEKPVYDLHIELAGNDANKLAFTITDGCGVKHRKVWSREMMTNPVFFDTVLNTWIDRLQKSGEMDKCFQEKK